MCTHTTHTHKHQDAASGIGGMSLGKKEQEQKEKIARMRELTNADESTARFWLESFSWDLERVRWVGNSSWPHPTSVCLCVRACVPGSDCNRLFVYSKTTHTTTTNRPLRSSSKTSDFSARTWRRGTRSRRICAGVCVRVCVLFCVCVWGGGRGGGCWTGRWRMAGRRNVCMPSRKYPSC